MRGYEEISVGGMSFQGVHSLPKISLKFRHYPAIIGDGETKISPPEVSRGRAAEGLI